MSENIYQIFTNNPASSMDSTDLLYLGRSPYDSSDDFAITFANFVASIGTSTPTASTIVRYDANINISANNFIPGFQSIATAASSTTLTVASPYATNFTGSTTQTVLMPVVSTLAVDGVPYLIINSSSGVVTVESSGGNTIQAMAANTTLLLINIAITGTSAAAWKVINYSTSDTTYPLSLALGGTNNSLTASAGGIVWSDSSKLNILSGTSTAGQLLISGDAATPAWTTSTYPSTNAVNTLLYASSANTMAALATADNGVLITSNAGVPSWLANGTAGYVLTANSGAPPSWQADGYLTGAVLLSPAAAQTISTYELNVPGGIYTPEIFDSNANDILTFTTRASAINYINIGNNTTGNSPTLAAIGSDSNVSLFLETKGTGAINLYTAAPTTPLVIYSGTSNQHITNFSFANTSNTDTYTFPDVSGTVTVLGNTVTGSGSIVLANSPTLVTPALGAATATSINFGGSTLSRYTTAGTFTPVFTFGTAGDLSVVYATQVGAYSVIGNIVTVIINLTFTPTYTTSSGSAIITGLPLTPTQIGVGSIFTGSVTFPAGTTMMSAYISPAGSGEVFFSASGSTVANAICSTTSFTTGQQVTVYIAATYLA